MAFAALFAAVLSAVAPFAISIGPIPLSLATLVVYLAAGTLDWKLGAVSVVLYIMLGAVGVPVFSNFQGGFYKIVGLTGGFIIGYIPCALATGIIIKLFGGAKPHVNNLLAYALGMVIGTILLYTCGTAWFVLQSGNPLAASIAICVTPFLPGDAIKIVLACLIGPQLRKAMEFVKRR